MEYGIIYHLIFPNGSYIGQTIQGENVRFKEHLRHTNAGSTLPVHNALRKYYNEDVTKNKVKRVILDKAYSLEELNNLEKKYIIEYNTFNNNGKNNNGYNMTLGGDGCKGYKYTEEQKFNCKKIQQKRKEERPDIAINHSIYMKQRAIDNPDIGIQHSKNMKMLYSNNPIKKIEMSYIKKQQNIDNPELAKRQSEIKLMMYEDKNSNELKDKIRKKSIEQWKDPEKVKKIMDKIRNKYKKNFGVYKDLQLIDTFDYIPDCSLKLFGNKDSNSNISAVLKGRRKHHKGYIFKYI